MALLEPLSLYLPTHPEKTVIKAYNTYSKAERKRIMTQNPSSFLHILGAGKNDVEPTLAIRKAYQKVLQSSAYQQYTPGYWVYQIEAPDRTYTGLVAGLPLRAIQQGKLRVHEATFGVRIAKLGAYLEDVQIQAEPIVAALSDAEQLQSLMEGITVGKPTIEFTFNTRTHRLWQVVDVQTYTALEKELATFNHCYLIDGHHRAAALQYVASRHPNTKPIHLLGYFLPEAQIKAASFFWFIRKLPKTFQATLFEKLGPVASCDANTLPNIHYPIVFQLHKQTYTIQKQGEWYPQLCELYRLLEEAEPQIDFFSRKNKQSLTHSFAKKTPDFSCCYLPLSFAEIQQVADTHGQVPPKTTYLHPKLLTGQFLSPL